MQMIGDHAVVLGAGIAGLLAARVLADAYKRVTVVERDLLPKTAENRRGVPQGRHAHLLVPRGAQILDELFPGLLADLAAGGVPVIQDFAELRFAPGGHHLRLEGSPAELTPYQASRPYLESHVRARVRALPTVEIIDRCEVVGLVATPARDRVTGVRIWRRDGGAEEVLEADLVLEATGRGSRTPAWLATVGYDQPSEEQLTIRLKYASRHLRMTSGALAGAKVVGIGAEQGRPTGIALFAEEENRWILTVFGYDGHHPPTDPEAFLDLRRDNRPTGRLRRDPRRRTARRYRRLRFPGQHSLALRAAAPLPGRVARLRRRDLQLESGLRPGDVGRRAASGGPPTHAG